MQTLHFDLDNAKVVRKQGTLLSVYQKVQDSPRMRESKSDLLSDMSMINLRSELKATRLSLASKFQSYAHKKA